MYGTPSMESLPPCELAPIPRSPSLDAEKLGGYRVASPSKMNWSQAVLLRGLARRVLANTLAASSIFSSAIVSPVPLQPSPPPSALGPEGNVSGLRGEAREAIKRMRRRPVRDFPDLLPQALQGDAQQVFHGHGHVLALFNGCHCLGGFSCSIAQGGES